MSTIVLRLVVSHMIWLPFLFWLIDCTSSNNPSALISAMNKNNNIKNISSSTILMPTYKISLIVSQQTMNIQSIQSPILYSNCLQQVKQITNIQSNRVAYKRRYLKKLKGSYAGGNTYIVKHGDTLFYISWITGNNLRDLARRNHILAPYNIRIGQKLQVGHTSGMLLTPSNIITTTNFSSKSQKALPTKTSNMINHSHNVIVYSRNSNKQGANKKVLHNKKIVINNTSSNINHVINSTKPTTFSKSTTSLISNWCWPTEGRIIESFSPSEGGNKGIDITGSKRQIIVATADGRIVYAGNALRGYGNLIIIKHNDDYLSAYAHNDTILVREQQVVKAGQKIATMGNTGTSSTRLHFEIRYKGKSVNPLQYLPHR